MIENNVKKNNYINKYYVDMNFNSSDFRHIKIVDCTFENCLFNKVNFYGVSIKNSSFKNCQFINSKMNNAFLNLNIQNQSGEFFDCTFDNCDLSKSSFNFPIINGCNFKNCNLYQTNFDGSRFCNVTFEGLLDSCFFNGYSIYAKNSPLSLKKGYSKVTNKNPMKNVSFEKAILQGVSFNYDICLEDCKFPDDEQYIFVKNPPEVFEKVINKVESLWSDPNKQLAINYIKKIYYTKSIRDPKNVFIDKSVFEDDGKNFTEAFFNIINESNG